MRMKWQKIGDRDTYSGAVWENEKGDTVEQILEPNDLGCGKLSTSRFHVVAYEATIDATCESKTFEVGEPELLIATQSKHGLARLYLQRAKQWCDNRP